MSASDKSIDNTDDQSNAVTGDESVAGSVAYGKALQEARKQKTMSIDDVAKSINVSSEIIEAIESSATVGLPPPTFVQGYIRSYARHVEIPVDPVLQDFARAVPHGSESELHARSNLPKETSSHSPLFKSLTSIMLLIVVIVLLYGIYSYYTEKMDDFASQEENVSDANGVVQIPQVRQDASMTEEGELQLQSASSVDGSSSLLQQEQTEYDSLASSLKNTRDKTAGISEDELAVKPEPAEPVLPQRDELTVYADQDSWIEFNDASGASLFYNLLKEGSKRTFIGAAPFDVFIGNAPAVELQVNGVEIEMTKFTRSNNIAQFRVSTDDGEPVFHSR